jgi:hypothetical protein
LLITYSSLLTELEINKRRLDDTNINIREKSKELDSIEYFNTGVYENLSQLGLFTYLPGITFFILSDLDTKIKLHNEAY